MTNGTPQIGPASNSVFEPAEGDHLKSYKKPAEGDHLKSYKDDGFITQVDGFTVNGKLANGTPLLFHIDYFNRTICWDEENEEWDTTKYDLFQQNQHKGPEYFYNKKYFKKRFP